MSSSGDGVRLRSSARTSVGQVRENNEDSVHLWPGDVFVLAVVADGMGGAAAGEEASRLAVESIQSGMSLMNHDGKEVLGELSDEDISERLHGAIQQANLSIMQRATEEPDMRGMGTTVTLAFVRGKEVIIAHVGDSRAYLVDGASGKIKQITSDHSFVEALLAAGHITPEQADEHPMRHVLYRALGQAEDVDIDIYNTRLHVGDRLVLCSDGLTRHVTPEEIAELALSDMNPDAASQKLIDLTNERGGEDNVSVIVISVERENPDSATQTEDAAFAAEEDDETLVLKERPYTRADIVDAGQPEEVAQDSNTGSKQQDETQNHPKSSLNKHKMRAERVSETLESACFNTPVFEPSGPVSTPEPPPKSCDGDGEGRDTRIPEQ